MEEHLEAARLQAGDRELREELVLEAAAGEGDAVRPGVPRRCEDPVREGGVEPRGEDGGGDAERKIS